MKTADDFDRERTELEKELQEAIIARSTVSEEVKHIAIDIIDLKQKIAKLQRRKTELSITLQKANTNIELIKSRKKIADYNYWHAKQ